MIETEELAQTFVELADSLVDDFDIVDLLQTLTERAVAITGVAAAGLMLSNPGDGLRFMAATSPTGRMLELLQLQASQGPCLDCFNSGQRVINADLRTAEERWPVFAPVASSAGFTSVHAFPLRLRSETIGALNLFGVDTILQDQDLSVIQALADVATIAILQERAVSRSEELTEQLQTALQSRIVIEQAKGAVAQRLGISLDEAFHGLRQEARSFRRRLIDVAQEHLDQRG